MNREEIYDKACEFADERINEGMLYDIRTEIRFAFERGAEWMREQCDEEYLEVVEQKEELCKIMYENRATYAREKERLQAEIDILHNDVCELESANRQKSIEIGFLKEKIKKIRKSDDKVIRRVQKSSLAFFDALHEEVIKKAWNIFYNKNGAITYSEFVNAMKE